MKDGVRGVVTALAWFPAGDYEDAISRWSSLAEDWALVRFGAEYKHCCATVEYAPDEGS